MSARYTDSQPRTLFDSMDFILRPLTEADIPALQRVYEAAPAALTRLIGRPAPPDQAANDLTQALQTPGRYALGVTVDEELVGVVDCRLDDDIEGQAHIGLLLIPPPYDDPGIAGLALRILARWLATLGVRRLETSVLAHVPSDIAFWKSQGFEFTGEQYRRELPGYAPRLLVMGKDLPPDR